MRDGWIVLVALGAALVSCNTKTRLNEAHCAALSASECANDRTCVPILGTELVPDPAALAKGQRCDPRCGTGIGVPDSCDWTTPPGSGAAPNRVARDGRYCGGPPRCQLQSPTPNAYDRAPGQFCFDPDPPCAGCGHPWRGCRSANLCNDVICP